MIQPIVTDKDQLSIKSEDATREDASVIADLLDTFEEHADECICMAANMIGVHKRIIVILDTHSEDAATKVMVNPVVIDRKQPYFAEEECISRQEGKARGAKRYKRIRVRYLDENFEEHTEAFRELDAQMVQHCIDHCNGVYI